MRNEGTYVALGLKVWKAQIERADKLFGSLSSEEVLREIAPGRNRLLYLWGHLTAIHDAMLPLLGLRERLHPIFYVRRWRDYLELVQNKAGTLTPALVCAGSKPPQPLQHSRPHVGSNNLDFAG